MRFYKEDFIQRSGMHRFSLGKKNTNLAEVFFLTSLFAIILYNHQLFSV